MVDASSEITGHDNGGKRSGVDRRQFSYSSHIPERRSNKDRRGGFDRRKARDSNFKGRERREFLYIEGDDP